ncbi:MAG TPA: metallophosphoesterase family protein [Ktedonobacteraceae bacterium]|jgi:putative phosphoesterase
MRIAVIADIHGNQVALEAVLADLALRSGIDELVIAGDLCLNGPQPREVLEIIQDLHCPVIMGNVDEQVVNPKSVKGEKKRSVITWTQQAIGTTGIAYLANLPTQHLVENPEGTDLLVVHANPLDKEAAIFPTTPNSKLEHLLGNLPHTIGALAFGHLHIAYTRRWQHMLLVDVGSCGLPRDKDQRASYAIIEWRDGTWQAEHHRVAYDVNEVVKQLKQSGMPHAEKRIKVLTEAKY